MDSHWGLQKRSVWESICTCIKRTGIEGSQELQWFNCEGKWKSLTSAYRKTVNHNWTGNDRREYASFNELSDVYRYNPSHSHNKQHWKWRLKKCADHQRRRCSAFWLDQRALVCTSCERSHFHFCCLQLVNDEFVE